MLNADLLTYKSTPFCFFDVTQNATTLAVDVNAGIKPYDSDYLGWKNKVETQIQNPPQDIMASANGDNVSDGFDPLMPQALRCVIENGQASISMLQRRLVIGYPRAARIIDQMQDHNFISAQDWADLLSQFSPSRGGSFYCNVTFFCQDTNAWETRQMYVSDRTADIFLRDSFGNIRGYQNASLSLVEV